MINEQLFFDIYLWTFKEDDKIIKIEHLTYGQATKLCKLWHKLNALHEYMLVTEASTPFRYEVSIEIKTKEWLLGIGSID